MRRFTVSPFSRLGTRQSRAATIEGNPGATIEAERGPLIAADREAGFAGVGGYFSGRSAAIPDVSGGVSVAFEEVYPI